MAAFVEEHGELTDGLLTIIKPFDYIAAFATAS